MELSKTLLGLYLCHFQSKKHVSDTQKLINSYPLKISLLLKHLKNVLSLTFDRSIMCIFFYYQFFLGLVLLFVNML